MIKLLPSKFYIYSVSHRIPQKIKKRHLPFTGDT